MNFPFKIKLTDVLEMLLKYRAKPKEPLTSLESRGSAHLVVHHSSKALAKVDNMDLHQKSEEPDKELPYFVVLQSEQQVDNEQHCNYEYADTDRRFGARAGLIFSYPDPLLVCGKSP